MTGAGNILKGSTNINIKKTARFKLSNTIGEIKIKPRLYVGHGDTASGRNKGSLSRTLSVMSPGSEIPRLNSDKSFVVSDGKEHHF